MSFDIPSTGDDDIGDRGPRRDCSVFDRIILFPNHFIVFIISLREILPVVSVWPIPPPIFALRGPKFQQHTLSRRSEFAGEC